MTNTAQKKEFDQIINSRRFSLINQVGGIYEKPIAKEKTDSYNPQIQAREVTPVLLSLKELLDVMPQQEK